ncbi:MAG: nucleotidyl transferase AbiEii/AbiGii toxin family protein [Rickettsiaceae bacterium]|nr:nucleotidyl transferase AbiEii/AbiGii toxin family protein [Rickettsiaceae bacterium]
MITIHEIRSVATKMGLTNTVIEKDYALGWLLWGMNNHPISSNDWVFKGGTCLKKCYLETYRYSEDLDFSYAGSEQLTVKSLSKILEEISDNIFEEAGLEFPKSTIKFEIFENPRGTVSIQGGIKYRGPVRPQVGIDHMPRIKIDLTLDETIIIKPIIKNVRHEYSDLPRNGISILSYEYEEVFAEKLRALTQRLRPRDLYDVVHLYNHKELQPKRDIILSIFSQKCQQRNIPLPTIETFENHNNRTFIASEWENQLKHQIPVLPDFKVFINELPNIIKWLYE